MAHFAEIDSSNKVINVIVIPDEHQDDGEQYCQNLLNSTNRWLQTSFNTVDGFHIKGGTPFRKQYAAIGYTYEETLDAFVPPKKFNSWILDEETCTWKAPRPKPDPLPEGTLNKSIQWQESILMWVVIDDPKPEDAGPNEAFWFNEQECRWEKISTINVTIPEHPGANTTTGNSDLYPPNPNR